MAPCWGFKKGGWYSSAEKSNEILKNSSNFICRRRLFDEGPEDSNYAPLPEDRPGGFNWGEEQAQNEDDWKASPIQIFFFFLL